MKALMMLLGMMLGLATQAHAATYYVRADGGSFEQCDGLSDVPYTSRTKALGRQPAQCAWSHPFVALPPVNNEHHIAPRIAGGDTLMIASGSYRMGYGASPETSVCYSNSTYDCRMQPVPAGPDAAHPTRIIGDCAAPPQLWGDQGAYAVLDLTRSSNTEVNCLEITDHESCILNHCAVGNCTGAPDQIDRCTSGESFGNLGLLATDAANVKLTDVNIHGMAGEGVRAGRLTDWTVTNLRLWANGFAGWDGDVNNGGPQNSSDHGNMIFDNLVVAWSGCGERYPSGEIFGCWDQNEGGYGDGLGTGQTSGNWTFVNSTFFANASDGLDLLYADGTGSVFVSGLWSEGNAGNQVKIAGSATMVNSTIVGSCAQRFSTFPPNDYRDEQDYNPNQFVGQYNMELSGNCRASGDAVATASTAGSHTLLVNNTITGQSNCLVINTNSDFAGATVTLANNILDANHNADWLTFATGGGVREVCAFYQMPENGNQNVTFAQNIIWGARNGECEPGNICADPLMVNDSVVALNPTLLPGSPAIGAGDPSYCAQAGLQAPCDIGATPSDLAPPPPPPGYKIWIAQGAFVRSVDPQSFIVTPTPNDTHASATVHWTVTQGDRVIEFPNSNQLTITYKKALSTAAPKSSQR